MSQTLQTTVKPVVKEHEDIVTLVIGSSFFYECKIPKKVQKWRFLLYIELEVMLADSLAGYVS